MGKENNLDVYSEPCEQTSYLEMNSEEVNVCKPEIKLSPDTESESP